MAKIDRLVWAAGLSFTAYGVRIGIRANKPEALEGLEKHLPLGWKPSSGPFVHRLYSLIVANGERANVRYYHLLYADALRMVRTLESRDIFSALEQDLDLYVAEQARRRVFVHAGVVGWKGRAIVIPGHSHSGKTTLVAALVRAGATYYSDEYAVLDAQGRVYPYARPLSIRGETDELPRKTPVEALGGQPGRGPLPVGTVVVTQYQPGGTWRPRTLSPGKAALKLFEHTVSARRAPERALVGLEQVVGGARTLMSVRGETDDLVGALLNDRKN